MVIPNDRETILSLISKGKFKTSQDLPPLTDTGKIKPEQMKAVWEKLQPKEQDPNLTAPGLGLLEYVSAAGAPIAGTKSALKLWKTLTLSEWVRRLGPRAMGAYRKAMGRRRTLPHRNVILEQNYAKAADKVVAVDPKGAKLWDPYQQYESTYMNMNKHQLAEALDIPKAARPKATLKQLRKIMRNKTDPSLYGTERDRGLMHVLEQPNTLMLDLDYTSDILHTAPGSANVDNLGQAVDAIKRIASENPGSLMRTYMTTGGVRSFNIGKGQVLPTTSKKAQQMLKAPENDEWYRAFTTNRQVYSSRISPKIERTPGTDFVAEHIGDIGTGVVDASKSRMLKSFHDSYIDKILRKYSLKEGAHGKGLEKALTEQQASTSSGQWQQILKNLSLGAVPPALYESTKKSK